MGVRSVIIERHSTHVPVAPAWLLVGLTSVILVGGYPECSIVIAAIGGGLVGWFTGGTQRGTWVLRGPRAGLLPIIRNLRSMEVYFLPIMLTALFLSSRPHPAVSLSVLAVLAVSWISRAIDPESPTSSSLVSLPAALLLASSFLGLIVSLDVRLTFSQICVLILGLWISDWISAFAEEDRRVDLIFFLMSILGVLTAFGALMFMQSPHEKIPFLREAFLAIPTIFPRQVHPNFVAGALTLFLPVSIGLALTRSRRPLSLIYLPVYVMLAVLLLTQSRGAIIGILVALGGMIVLAHRSRMIVAVSAAGLVLTGGGYCLLYPEVFTTFLELGESQDVSGRPELWGRAMNMIQDFPLTGIGLGSFSLVLPLLYPIFTVGPDAHMPHAHNLFLQVAVDMGLLGFTAFCILIGTAGRMWWQGFKAVNASGNLHFRYLLTGIFGAALAHFCYSITDAIPVGEKAGILRWGLLGAMTALTRLAVRERLSGTPGSANPSK